MKTINYYIFTIAAALCVASCSQEVSVDVRPNDPACITASIDISTKTTLSESAGLFAFSNGDAIALCNEDVIRTGTTTSTSNTATFTVPMFDDIIDGIAGFPASLVSDMTNSTVTFTLPTSYAYSAVGGADPDAANVICPMIGTYTSGNSVSLKHAGAVIRVRLTNIAAGSVSFTFTESSITGTCTLNAVPALATEGIIAAGLESAGGTVTIHDVPDVPDGTYVYVTFPVPVGTAPHEILVTNTPDDGALANRSVAITGSTSPINRAMGYKMSARPVVAVVTPTFKVAADRTVVLAPGNLMALIDSYADGVATASSWKFGGPYEIIGDNSSNGNYLLETRNASCVGKWVDMFGWQGASATNKVHGLFQAGVNTDEMNGSEIAENLYDGCWNTYLNNVAHEGYIQISNGGDYTWRPMTSPEFTYLMSTREGAVIGGTSGCRFSNACIAGIHGQLIFPDSDVEIWDLLTMGSIPVGNGKDPAFNVGTETTASYEANTYSASQVLAMQAAGMVFLPCGGYRGAGSITGANVKVNYWTSSGEGTTKDKAKTKTSNSTTYGGQRYVGRLIRLVREVDPD